MKNLKNFPWSSFIVVLGAACMCGEASAYDGAEVGKVLKDVNTFLTSSVAPLVFGAGAVASLGYSVMNQSITPLLYGGAGLAFYKGATVFTKDIATLLIS